MSHDIILIENQAFQKQNVLLCHPLCASTCRIRMIVLFLWCNLSCCLKTCPSKDPWLHREFHVKTLEVSILGFFFGWLLNLHISRIGCALESKWVANPRCLWLLIGCTFTGKAKQLAQASAAARSSSAANSSDSTGKFTVVTRLLANNCTPSSDYLRIRDLHDPDNQYSGLGSLKETKVECPNVHDSNGLLIHPREYSMKLAWVCFVEVKLYLKL